MENSENPYLRVGAIYSHKECKASNMYVYVGVSKTGLTIWRVISNLHIVNNRRYHDACPEDAKWWVAKYYMTVPFT